MMQTGKRKGAIFAVTAVVAIALVFLWQRPSAGEGAGGSGTSASRAAAAGGNDADQSVDSHSPPLPGQRVEGSLVAGGPVELPAITEAAPDNLPSVDAQDPVEYDTKLPLDTLYAAMPAARAHFADKLPFGIDDRSYVEFNRNALRALEPGATLTVRTPDDGREHRIRIDEVTVHPNGDKSWLGRIDDGRGGAMPAVFTQGVDSTFGSFDTATGSYSLEAEGRLGWIANVNDLRKHQDFSIPDVMEPDPARGRPVPSTN